LDVLEKKPSNYCDVAPLEQTTFTTVMIGLVVGVVWFMGFGVVVRMMIIGSG